MSCLIYNAIIEELDASFINVIKICASVEESENDGFMIA